MAKGAGNEFKLPGAVEVRNGLIASLGKMSALDEDDRSLFLALAAGYSGLADLAVPSWILCASMVKVGGRIALVVPESWLSRDYASAVHYLLMRWFVVEHIVEDEHAAWFEDAQVKTTLLVARRVARRPSAFDWGDEFFVRSRISGKASGNGGPIARLYPEAKNPEARFAKDAWKVANTGKPVRMDLCEIIPSPISSMSKTLEAAASKQKWFGAVGETPPEFSSSIQIPAALASWVGGDTTGRFTSLESLGISVGQGLRTGANRFFYADMVSTKRNQATLFAEGLPAAGRFQAPLDCVRPVIRKQSELPSGFSVHADALSGRVLDLRRVALEEDLDAAGALADSSYATMDESLSAFIRHAASADFGKDGVFRLITELSAVAPNIRRADLARGIPPRFWYMLPDFAPRHLPDLIVPRVNGGSPRALHLADKGIVADANFATLNVPQKGPDAHAVLALLNSTWCQAILENSASVMGGGALKVEAAHLRRIPVPLMSPARWKRLSELGQRLAETGKGLAGISRLVASAALGRQAKKEETAYLSALAEEGRARREKHKNKKGA
jgi:hypothetical protein